MAGALAATPAVLLFAYFGFPATERPVTIPVAVVAELLIILAVYWFGCALLFRLSPGAGSIPSPEQQVGAAVGFTSAGNASRSLEAQGPQ